MNNAPKYLDKPVPICPHDYKSIAECHRRGGLKGLIALFGECGESCPFHYEVERDKLRTRISDLEMQKEAKVREITIIEMRIKGVEKQVEELDKKWK